MPTAGQVANEIITYYTNTLSKPLTPLALQKLVYFCDGWHWASVGSRLIDGDEEFQAWKHGPVLPSLYQRFKYFRSSPIPAHYVGISGEGIIEDGPSKELVHNVLNAYHKYTPSNLVNMSHASRGPWANVYRENIESLPISNDSIRNYFVGLSQQNNARQA